MHLKTIGLKKFFWLLPVLALALTLFGYSAAEAKGGHGPHWGYSGDEGPEHWGDLSADYAACKDGKSQSPVNITGAVGESLSPIEFSYGTTKLNILNNGHTIQVNYDEGSSITVNGKKFNLLQFHFHGPSEHEVDGKLAAMETHFVHKSDDGALAVVGVLIMEGAENANYAGVWSHLPAHADHSETVDLTVDANSLLPAARNYTTYSGSLTTPPCSEGVTWLVLSTPIEMSKAQIEAFGKITGANNRPVQPLNDRSLKASK